MMGTVDNDAVVIGGVYATGVGSDIKETYRIKKQVDDAYFSEVFLVLQSMEQHIDPRNMLFLELQCHDGALLSDDQRREM